MIFMISLTLLVTVMTEGVLTGAVVIVFFWILLLVFDQMALYPVNHYFCNLMPLRMTDFTHYYIGNETYRILGNSISSLSWVILVSLLSSVFMMISTISFSNIRLRKGLK